MYQHRLPIFKYIFIVLIFILLRIDVWGQNAQETHHDDSTHHAMEEEGGKNYAPAYYYYIHSQLPTTIEQTLIDTSVYNPYNEDVSLFSRNLYAHLGIFGQAHYPMNFSFYRKHGFSYKTLPYSTYLRTIENWQFFLPEGVYTNLQYNFSNGKENHFSIKHAQKITDNLNLDAGLETIIAEGRYVRQKIRNVNFGVSLRYNLPSNRYGFAAYYFLNLIKNQENGGILHDSLLKSGNSPSSIGMRFSNNQAYNQLFQNTFFFRQYLSLSGKQKQNDSLNIDTVVFTIKNTLGYLVHDFEYSSSKNRFSATGLDTAFLPMFHFDEKNTNDSTKNYQIRNSILWSSYKPDDTMPDKQHFIRFAAGVMHTFIHLQYPFFTNFNDTDFTVKMITPLFQFTDNQITPLGMMHLKLFNRFQIKANALVTLNGYNAGDITIDGKMLLDISRKEQPKHEMLLKMAFYNYSPDYFFTRLTANNDDLEKQQTITAGIAWEHNQYSVGLNYYVLNNYTFINEHRETEQISNFANVYQFAAYIPFHFKGFGFNSNIYVQYADNEKIKIPVFVTRQTVYYGFPMFRKKLYLQVGLDFLYNTAYYANAYNPVLQQFYVQESTQIGNYPYLDVYLRAKINRFQFQVKGTHLYSGLLEYNYYLVPHYPVKNRGFAIGILWNFYD